MSRPGSTTTPLRSSTSGTPGGGSAAGGPVGVVAVVGSHREDPDELPRADVRPAEPVDELGGRPQRQHEEGGVPIERDELTYGDVALEGVPGAEPGDDEDEDAGQEHLGGVERGLDARHPVADPTHLLGLARVPAQEGVFAADAAQHPQPRDGVGAQPDQPAGLLALVGLALLQGPDDEGEEGDEHRDADEDDEAQGARRAEEDERDDDIADDGADHPGEDVEQPTEPHRVGGDDGDDVTGGRLPGQRLADVGAVPADQLDRAERRPEPVVHREPVPPRPGERADDAKPDQDAAPQQQRPGLARDDPLVDGPAHRGREEGLSHHPEHAEAGRHRERAPLSPAHPAQEAQRAAQVRGARMLVRKAHKESPYARDPTCPTGFRSPVGRSTWPSRRSPRLGGMSREIAAGAGVERVRGVPHGSRGAVVAVGAVFAINGLAIGGWAGVLPALRSRLGIDAGTLAVLLFIVGVAAVISMQVGGRMADRVGARRVTLTALPLMVVGAAVLAFADSFPLAVVAGVLLGLGNGATDVAMNALGVAVEKARPMPVMSRFHAFWSIGSFGGAAVVFLSAWLFGDENGSVILPAMIAIVALTLAGLLVTLRWIPETEPVSHTVDGRKEPIPPVAWLLGAMAVFSG